MMIRTYGSDITLAANAETVETLVTGKEGIRKTVRRLAWEQNAGVDCRAYIDTDRIVDAGSEVEALDSNWLDVDAELAAGQELKVGGYNNTGGAITAKFVVQIEESGI
jgi:hypothetical protein